MMGAIRMGGAIIFLIAGMVCAKDDSSINFLAIGDWGPDPNSTSEVAVASGMGKVADEIGMDFATLLGDNFYPSGIHGDATNSRFHDTFESVFSAQSLQDIPFYAIAGNHDHKGNVSAEIEYTKYSKRWTYPDWYYKVTKTFANGTRSVDLIFIDTVILAGDSEDVNGNGLRGSDLPGPEDWMLAATQAKWLKNEMESSKADYLFVMGHYPVYSIGSHGPTFLLELLLKPLLEANGAHYLCGHDHDLEHIDPGKGVQYIVTGSGGYECCYDDVNLHSVPKDSVKFAVTGKNGKGYQPQPLDILGGFVSVRIGTEEMEMVIHAHTGEELHSTGKIPRRTKTN